MKVIFERHLCKVIGIFISMWLVYYVLELFSGNIRGTYSILMNLIIPILFLSIMAGIFYYTSLRSITEFSSKRIVLLIIILIIIEQGTKLIIRSAPSLGSNHELIANWLYFYPVLNTLGSWGASRFGLTLGIKVFLVINIFAIPLVVQLYRFYISENAPSFWINTTFVLCFSGIFCSMIDKMFFGGSLDFLMLKDLFVADIKDFYITLSIGCLLTEILLNYEPENKGSFKDDMDLFRRFANFNLKDFKRFKKIF